MEKELEAAATTQDGQLTTLGFRTGLAAARGEMRKARDYARQTDDALDRLHLQGRADLEAGMAGAEALAGNRSEAIRGCEAALKLSRSLSVLGNAATTYAVLGETQRALALADEIQRTHPNDTLAVNVTIPMIRAIAAMRPGNSGKADPGKAIDFLNTAALYARASADVSFARGMAYEQAGRYPEAQQELQKVLSFKTHKWPDIVFPRAQLELGRVYQKQNDIPQARIAYQNFLAAWKDADPDLPLLREAKAEYAKLQ
jgi:tetratricopeptide (TPR) repeat protein